jgi:serine/threonine protein kinase/tetratricopeptide (TPR) repeat protein
MWIGQYRLTSRIATGGMAEVYVGRHISQAGDFGPMVAVKRLLPHLVSDASIVRMFLNEARITAQIAHPNVVKVFELGQVDGEPFIAMELLDGRTWADLRNRSADDGKRMPIGVALSILTLACKGLDAAHRALDDEGQPLALVHRDFTPDNIHVGFKGEVKVIDFGIAKTKSWGSGTEPGTLKGKFFYMSPEMILGRPVDHRADIFAAGVMLYEQLCGHRPFTGNSIDEVVIRIAQAGLVPPSTYDPAVPRTLEAICMLALEKEPDARFQTMATMVDALQAVGGEAELAGPDQVGAYVSTLFPETTDTRRQTLRKARERDPSMPRMRPGSTPLSGTQALAAPPLPDAPPPPLVAALQPPPLSPEARPPRRGLWAGLAVGTLAALGVGAFFVLRPPGLTPPEALASAGQTVSAQERLSLLMPLARSPLATDEDLTRAAALLSEAKQYDAVLELVDVWLLRSPKSLEARLAEAQAATQAHKGRRAETAIKEAVALAPRDPRPDRALAQLRELQGDAEGALEAWTKLNAKAPTASSRARQGFWLSQLGHLDEADEVLSKALRRQSDAAIAAELGFVKFRLDQTDEALKLLRQAVKDRPTLLEAHYYLAAVLYQKGDVRGARAEYLEADKLAGSDPRPLAALCEMEQIQQSSQLEEARRRIRERFPTDAEAMLARCASIPSR